MGRGESCPSVSALCSRGLGSGCGSASRDWRLREERLLVLEAGGHPVVRGRWSGYRNGTS